MFGSKKQSMLKDPAERIKDWLSYNKPEDHGFEVFIEDFDLFCEDFAEDYGIADSLDTFSFNYYGPDEITINTVEDLLIHVIDSDNQAVELLTELARYNRSQGYLANALYWAQKAVILSEDKNELIEQYFDACIELGNCYFSDSEPCNLPDLIDAAKYYKRGCDNLSAARAYIGLGEYDKAESELELIKLIGVDNSTSLANAWLGQMYFIQNNIPKALKYWQLSIEGCSGWGEYFMGRYLWGIEHKYNEAVSLWQQGYHKHCNECQTELYHYVMFNDDFDEETMNEWHDVVAKRADLQIYNAGYQFLYDCILYSDALMDIDIDIRQADAQHYIELGLRNFCPYCADTRLLQCQLEGFYESTWHYERVKKCWGWDNNAY